MKRFKRIFDIFLTLITFSLYLITIYEHHIHNIEPTNYRILVVLILTIMTFSNKES
jgi:hypothetical protein